MKGREERRRDGVEVEKEQWRVTQRMGREHGGGMRGERRSGREEKMRAFLAQ